MSRRIWPHAFQLFTAPLDAALDQGVAEKTVAEYVAGLPHATAKPGNFGVPVAARWTLLPALGVPRRPFILHRRSRSAEQTFVDLAHDPQTVAGLRFVDWGLREMYEVRYFATPAAGQTLTIQALDRRREPIPGQRLVVDSATPGRFRMPGIAALSVTGNGTIALVSGMDQLAFANEKGWQRVEAVGLPLARGEVDGAVYSTDLQGYETPSVDGERAALDRLEIARRMQLPPPATGIADLPAPAWPAPEPRLYLEGLRAGELSALSVLLECLRATDDADGDRMQVAYLHQALVSGMRQADIAGEEPEDPTELRLPAVGTTLLAAGSDAFAASGLGFGTIDFPPRAATPRTDSIDPPGSVETAFDYMVTSSWTLPLFGTLELAALAVTRQLPEAPAQLEAARLQLNRAPERDSPLSESRRLSWLLPSLPQGYGIALSARAGEARVLNTPRRGAGGFDPFVPQRPAGADGSQPLGVRSSFTDPVAPLATDGSATAQYLAIGLDVFGRWSSWSTVAYTSDPLPVALPALQRAALVPVELDAQTRVAGCELELELAWDWSDRSPARVELSGAFFAAGDAAPGTPVAGFALRASGPAQPPVVLEWNSGDEPFVASGHEGATVDQLAVDPPDPDHRVYRVRVKGLECSFESASERAYAVFARAEERVRPGEQSAQVGPVAARLRDPFPPAEPELPLDLQWTALPDATGRARGMLALPATSDGAGFVVWQAAETALREAVAQGLPDLPHGTPPVDRAAALRELLSSSQARERAMRAFTRINTALVRDTSYEVELPGAADVVYAYRVSAVSTANVESARSDTIALFAVPRRNVPGTPRLLLRAAEGGIGVVAVAGPGIAPAGFRVYRTRNTALLSDVGLLGPPHIEHNDPGWEPIRLPRQPNAQLNGAGAEQGLTIVDPVAASWNPFYYVAVAVGADDLAAGVYSGESLAGASQSFTPAPATPPLLSQLELAADAAGHRVSWRTDLPINRSPLGDAVITIARLEQDILNGALKRVVLERLDPAGVPEGDTAAPSDASSATRTPPDAEGRASFSVRLPQSAVAGATALLVSLRDPLGRTSEVRIEV